MSNCGCTDTTPCTSQECGCKFEVDAGCVRYTGDTLSCIDAQTGDLLSDILLELNTKFCNLVEGNFIEVSQEVAGANCEVGGIKIVVKNINTLAVINTEYLCQPDISSFVTGFGKVDRVTRWTPVDGVLGESIIRDNGDQLSIGAAPDSASKVYIVDNIYSTSQKIVQSKTTGINNTLSVQSSGVGATANSAIVGSASGATVNIAVSGSVSGSGSNYGGFFQSSNATTNVGVYGQASGTGIKYSSQLIDGTEGIGKVLTCMTSDGKANWVTPPAGITGSGINDYIARWTPDGTTLGIGIVRDNGNSVGINASPDIAFRLYVAGSTLNGASFTTTKSATNSDTAFGISGESSGVSSLGVNMGVYGKASGNTNINYGVHGATTSVGAGKNVGLYGLAQGSTTANYAAQLMDGTEGIGKVLTCVTSDGKANWATPTGGGVSGSGTIDYVARWTPDGTTLGVGAIRDDGSRVGIGVAPGALGGTYKVYVRTTNDVVGLTAEQKTVAGSTDKVALQAIAIGSGGAGINIGLNALGSGSTTQNTGMYVGATSTGAASSLGGFLYASGGVTNNAVKLVDGTEGIGKVLTCVTADGMANWVTPATPPGGMTWTTLTVINPSAAMLPNHGYIIRDTSGAATVVTLPVYGTCSVGDKIEIIATGPSPASLSNWTIQPGQAGDTIYASYVNPSATDTLEVTLTTGGSGLPITFDGSVIGSIKCRKVSMTLVCVKDNATNYFWQMSTSTNYALV